MTLSRKGKIIAGVSSQQLLSYHHISTRKTSNVFFFNNGGAMKIWAFHVEKKLLKFKHRILIILNKSFILQVKGLIIFYET